MADSTQSEAGKDGVVVTDDYVIIDGTKYEFDKDPNAHNRVEPEDRGPGMDEPTHYTYARPEDKPEDRDIRVVDAAKAGDQALLKKLVKDDGCDVHQRGEQDWTALNFAAGKGDLETVKLLIEELGADPTAVGRDRRRPSAIARAANRRPVIDYLTEVEKERGVWEDPLLLRPYCKAFYLKDLRKFGSWSEERRNWKINKYWPDDIKAEFEKELEAEDVVFIHHRGYQVTRSMWHDEHVIFESSADDWKKFVETELKFEIPEDLR